MAQTILSDPTLRSALPPSFLYGAASASYQIEGAYLTDGKGPKVWDDCLKDKENGEVACDSYNLWREDVELLKRYGCRCYRFSISWARVRPLGGEGDPVNEVGVKYYSDLIDALIQANITPCITIFHWDHPLALQQRYQGFFEAEQITRDFTAYAKLLFERFGDRVKFWITINEPHIFTMLSSLSYAREGWVPGRDNARYAKSLLLCHASTVDLYRRKFKASQKGEIGITLNCDWVEPIDETAEAKAAAQIILDWVLGFVSPFPIEDWDKGLMHPSSDLGRFPQTCLEELGESAPSFTEAEWKLIKGSSEFFGWNHYGTSYATGKRLEQSALQGPMAGLNFSFGMTEKVYEKDGKVIGVRGENGHPYGVPWGFRKLMRYIYSHYTRPLNLPIYITENGFAVEGEASLPIDQAIKDPARQAYFAGYLKEMIEAVRDEKINIGGYMAWSLLDNLEWVFGYGPRFGVTVVDRADGCKRHPKDSAWVLRDIFAHAIGKE